MKCFPAAVLAGLLAAAVSASAADIPVRIPLYIFNSGTSPGKKEYKVGIRLKIAAISNGRDTPWRMYEFDTGGSGFLAFPYAATGTSNTAGTYTVNYASGNQLTGERRDTRIVFEGVTPSLRPSVRASLVVITGASSSTIGDPLNSWPVELSKGPPLETYFYGDFGMSLGALLPASPDSSEPPLYAIIPQLAGRNAAGFVIHLGPKPAENAQPGKFGEIGRGWIQVGLSPRDKKASSWQEVVAMKDRSAARYPGSRLPVYSEILSSGTLQLTGLKAEPTGIVYDTGAPNVEIHAVGSAADLDGPITEILNSDDTVSMVLTGMPAQPGRSATILDISVGDSSGENKVGAVTTNVVNSPGLYVNTGITAFFGRDVVFQLEDGFIGFRQLPPPSGPR